MQFDRAFPNALPIGYAISLAKKVEVNLDLILQANVVSHTDADAETRILGQPVLYVDLQPTVSQTAKRFLCGLKRSQDIENRITTRT
jgi:hypothetical protein